ncbi:LysM peptidoglycan-binding domain-containing M23 family metallopeptidase [Gudongella sp. DL1XJH-153]|uniref:LysM peptidoglycan-binding domain-containing M23 family metallopeptidase n=1 Tax=Gudongella sp. DL1XJH-153 TaxID=3409804 RepID=UPI003BB8029C
MKLDSSILDFINKNIKIDIKGNSKKWKLNNDRFRRFLAAITVVAVIGISFVSYSVNDTRTKAVDVYLGDEYIGVVRTEDEALQIYKDLEESLKSTYDMGVVLDKELKFEETNAKDEALTSAKDIKSNIENHINVSVAGFELIVDGESFGVFKSGQDVEYILDSVKSSFLPQVVGEEEDLDSEVVGITAPKTHTVQEGDNYWTIARQYNLTSSALEEANPGVNPSRLQAGDVINLTTDTGAREEVAQVDVPVIDNNADIKEVDFTEEIEVVKIETSYSKLDDPDETIARIRKGKEEMRTHIVEVGESYWIIAKMYDTTVEELLSANPDQDSQRLKPGDEVNLFVPTPLLTVKTVEQVQYTEETNFETQVIYDDSMYKNKKNITTKGVKGTSEIVANITKLNGIVEDKEIITTKTIVEPVTEVVVQGTKELPKTAATGSFMVPTSGRLSSPYGMRGGSMHRGIDLANRTGTNIYASDGGRVTFAGYKGSYGYMIEINHENGYVTRYAHASKLLVRSGERVYRGQHIAEMGNTGRSTGPHLHFEVLANGAHQNPSRFIY